MADYSIAFNPAQQDPDCVGMLKHSARPVLDTENYILSTAAFPTFINDVKNKIKEYLWDHIFNIPKLSNRDQVCNMTTHFQELTYKDVIHHDTHYRMVTGKEEDDYTNCLHIRNATNSFSAIYHSLSDAAKQHLKYARNLYMVNRAGSGPLLLFIILTTWKPKQDDPTTVLQAAISKITIIKTIPKKRYWGQIKYQVKHHHNKTWGHKKAPKMSGAPKKVEPNKK
jgi:hypothetical protein